MSSSEGKSFLLPIGVALGIIAVFAVASFILYQQNQQLNQKQQIPQPVACTQEAQQCPDGSYVSRTGANCEFAVCRDEFATWPASNASGVADAGWQTYTDPEYGFEIKFPQNAIVTLKPDIYNDSAKLRIAIDNNYSDTGSVTFEVDNKKSANDCRNSLVGSSVRTQKITINGINFETINYSDAAMGGQRASVFEYYTFYNNSCYKLGGFVGWHSVEFSHSATDGLQPTQEEIDNENKLIKERTDFITSIVSTFKFTN